MMSAQPKENEDETISVTRKASSSRGTFLTSSEHIFHRNVVADRVRREQKLVLSCSTESMLLPWKTQLSEGSRAWRSGSEAGPGQLKTTECDRDQVYCTRAAKKAGLPLVCNASNKQDACATSVELEGISYP